MLGVAGHIAVCNGVKYGSVGHEAPHTAVLNQRAQRYIRPQRYSKLHQVMLGLPASKSTASTY
jgi:hypothetical protein